MCPDNLALIKSVSEMKKGTSSSPCYTLEKENNEIWTCNISRAIKLTLNNVISRRKNLSDTQIVFHFDTFNTVRNLSEQIPYIYIYIYNIYT